MPTYRVWPDGTVQDLADEDDFEHLWLSDDYCEVEARDAYEANEIVNGKQP